MSHQELPPISPVMLGWRTSSAAAWRCSRLTGNRFQSSVARGRNRMDSNGRSTWLSMETAPCMWWIMETAVSRNTATLSLLRSPSRPPLALIRPQHPPHQRAPLAIHCPDPVAPQQRDSPLADHCPKARRAGHRLCTGPPPPFSWVDTLKECVTIPSHNGATERWTIHGVRNAGSEGAAGE